MISYRIVVCFIVSTLSNQLIYAADNGPDKHVKFIKASFASHYIKDGQDDFCILAQQFCQQLGSSDYEDAKQYFESLIKEANSEYTTKSIDVFKFFYVANLPDLYKMLYNREFKIKFAYSVSEVVSRKISASEKACGDNVCCCWEQNVCATAALYEGASLAQAIVAALDEKRDDNTEK